MSLPALREELAIYAGPAARLGSPTWSLYDPVRNLFFRIDWLTFEILSRWHLDDPQSIFQEIQRDTTIQPDTHDLQHVLQFLSDNELLQRHDIEGTNWYQEQAEKRRASAPIWLLHHYLFFRLPLWRPNAWLENTLHHVNFLYRPAFFIVTLVVLLVSLIEVSQQWPKFVSSLIDTFSWQGLLGYFVTLVLIKFLHELGHAYTAKRYGCRVPTMGVAFLVLFPMAYTDVNEVWKLSDRKQRLAVGAAGIVTELLVAAWATFAWIILPDGVARNAAFLLATTTWVSTLLINSSPFLRFDGYFLLMDWLDLPNLHARAFALAKWRVRQMLFGVDEPVPEHFSPRRYYGILCYAYATWIYRLIVFGGIAMMVYTMLPKPLGPILAAIEIVWFIWLPVWKEMQEWPSRMVRMPHTRRGRLTLLMLMMMLMASFLPWDHRIHAQGVLKPALQMPIVSPGPAQIKSILLQNGQQVKEGEPLIVLDAPDLKQQLAAAQTRAASYQWQVGSTGVSSELLEQQQVLAAAYNKAQAEIEGIQQEQKRYQPNAQFSGKLFYTDPGLQTGSWVGKNEQFAVLLDGTHWQVETYLSEAELGRIKVGDRGYFYSETPHQANLAVQIGRIDRDASHTLPEPILAVPHGGEILVRSNNKQLVPEKALYRVTLLLEQPYAPHVPQTLRGQIVLYGQPESYVSDFIYSAAALIVREAGF